MREYEWKYDEEIYYVNRRRDVRNKECHRNLKEYYDSVLNSKILASMMLDIDYLGQQDFFEEVYDVYILCIDKHSCEEYITKNSILYSAINLYLNHNIMKDVIQKHMSETLKDRISVCICSTWKGDDRVINMEIITVKRSVEEYKKSRDSDEEEFGIKLADIVLEDISKIIEKTDLE